MHITSVTQFPYNYIISPPPPPLSLSFPPALLLIGSIPIYTKSWNLLSSFAVLFLFVFKERPKCLSQLQP